MMKVLKLQSRSDAFMDTRELLVVVDMQNDFITGALGTAEAQAIVPNVKAKIDEFIENGQQVIFTRDTHYEDYLETQEGFNLPVVHCVEGTPGWEIESSLQLEDAMVFDKVTFGSPELAAYIQEAEFDVVTLVGVCTDICVISNAMLIKAFDTEVLVQVDSACCAGVTPEAHDNALKAMKQCQIEIL